MAQIKIIVRGGIGSGKSAVSSLFEERGATIISADQVGHTVLAPEGEAFDAVATRWPAVVVDGTIDRARLAEIVFSDRTELDALEAITHPAIRSAITKRVAEIDDGPVVVELPLPTDFLDGEWVSVVVDAPDDVRHERLVARGMSPRDIERRMENQPSRVAWLALGDHVLDNSGDFDSLAVQVDELWEALTGA